MSKKKRFGISQALTRGLSETINVVENNAGIFRNIILPISRIELDPENPRKMAIDLIDVQYGIKSEDTLYQQKQDELERLKEMAVTVKNSGIINPIVVYKRGELYRIVAGERRCLASILAGRKEIEARVFNEKPKGFDLKLLQWVENTAREDLSLAERLGNIRDLLQEYQQQHGETEMNATLLKSLTGLSLPQATYYMTVLAAPQDVQTQIESGHIRSLDKAAVIAAITAPDVRKEAIQACMNGCSLKELRGIISRHKALKKVKTPLAVAKQGRVGAKINMGSTAHHVVIKTIVSAVLQLDMFTPHVSLFSHINWDDKRQAAKAFRKLIELLEVEMAV